MSISTLLQKKEQKLNELKKLTISNTKNISNLINKNITTQKKVDEKKKKDDNNFILQYSPRTEFCTKLDEEDEMYNELKNNFDPVTIKIVKQHFKERLGSLKREEMIAILKNHLLGFLPNNPKRERIIIKLLSRLFSDIDINDNGDLEWNEFTDYIIHLGGSGDLLKSNIAYSLKFYSKSNKNINSSELEDPIGYSFYIEQYNVIGIVEENKSVIKFFDANTYSKLKVFIDLKDVQSNVDLMEFSKLNEKANLYLLKQEEEKKMKKSYMESGKINLLSTNKKVNSKSFYIGRRAGLAMDNRDFKSIMNFRKKRKDEQMGIIHNFHLLNEVDLNIKAQNKNLSVICTHYIPEYNLLMISSTNNTVTAWRFSKTEIKNVNATSDFKLTKDELKLAILIANYPQYAMIWDPQMKCLFTGQKDGKILKWELTNPNPIYEDTLDVNVVKKKAEKINKKETLYKNDAQNLFQKIKDRPKQFKDKINLYLLEDKKKNLSVSCLLILKKLQLLAASYYNGYVILWDTVLKEYRKYYFDQTTGVYAMAYDSIRNLLFTCGFSHDIYVYDPYIDCSSVYKLSGHTCSINNIDINEKESELISLDFLGNIRVWDTTALFNFQNIKINEEEEEISKKNQQKNKKQKLNTSLKMIYSPNMKKIFVYGNKMLFFETDRSNCPDLADDQAICACYYDNASFNLISFCLRKIKFWNLLTGKIRLIYDDPMGAEMTSIDVDKTCKRAYLGDNTGKIKIINLKNGSLLKNLESHNTEIKFLLHNQDLNIVASCSIDNVIKIHDDTELLQSEVIKEIKVTEDNISALCFTDKFKRLCIGLSNGTLKFYDIEHSHYDSDLDVESSSIKGEIRVIKELQNLELVLCCYSNGVCTFIVIPPSNAKYKTIYELNNNENEPISISCVELDNKRHHLFIGDILGNINCYNISEIYQKVESIGETNNKNNKGISAETIINKENINIFNNISIGNIWRLSAHEESIRHIHYIDVEPRIIVTSSYDLKIKIFSADTGKYKDEFKQIANRIKPVPIGIKYFILNPFGEKDINSEVKYIYRKDITNFSISQINNETNRQQITEVAKKITEYNAKEKLWLTCKNTTLPENMSNDWKLDINIEKLKEKEEEDYKKIKSQINEIEKITKETEKILMSQSLYSDLYKPKYIEEMKDMDKIKELSEVIQARLRNVKLAVSKANINYNKIMELSKKRQLQFENFNSMDRKWKRLYSAAFLNNNKIFSGKHSLIEDNSRLASTTKQLMVKKMNNNEEKEGKERDEKEEKEKEEKGKDEKDEKEEKEKEEKEKEQNLNNNSSIKDIMIFPKKIQKKSLRVRNIKQVLPDIKSQYAINRIKLKGPNDMFNKYHCDFSEGYKAIFTPFKKLFKKTKESSRHLIRVKSSIILNGYKRKTIDEDKNKDIAKEKQYMLQKRRNINNLEKCLKQLEQNSYNI